MPFNDTDRQTLRRIEAKLDKWLEGLEFKEQLNRIEGKLDVIPGGMTEEEMAANTERLKAIAGKLQNAAANPQP